LTLESASKFKRHSTLDMMFIVAGWLWAELELEICGRELADWKGMLNNRSDFECDSVAYPVFLTAACSQQQ